MPYALGQQLTIEEYFDAAQWIHSNAPTWDIRNIGDKLYEIVEKTPETAEQIAERRISELKKYLTDTDYVVIKMAEGCVVGDEYAPVLEKRRAARAEINQLENKGE